MAVSRILSAVNGFKNTLGVLFGDSEKNSGGTMRFAARLFPVPKRSGAYIEKRGKLRLRQTQSLSDLPYVQLVMFESTLRLRAAP
jgi:hypothetical protein